MNRTLSSQSRLNTVIKGQALRQSSGQAFNDRRARTRTLIQAGSLIKLSGLFTICEIEEGEDLQFDFNSRDKAATLLGILSEAAEAITNPPNAAQMETWRALGTRLLKQRAADVAYRKEARKIRE